MEPFAGEQFGSPASLHQGGVLARDALAQARSEVAALLNARSPDDILFTAGATEAANLAVKGTAWASHRHGNHIVLTETEHPAVTRSAEFLESQGFRLSKVPVDRQGFVDPEGVRAALKPETILVCIHHASHDLGTIQNLAEVALPAAEQGVPIFVDASASGGWVPIDVQSLPISLLSLAPHRFFGPKGVGILYRQRRSRLASLIHGGVQEAGLRAGTENVPAIVGAGAAATLAARELESRAARTSALSRRLREGLVAAAPLVKLNGAPPGPQRLPHHLNLSFEFLEGEGLVLAVDLQGVALHSGPACVSKSTQIPPALTAIGLSPALARASVMLAPGPDQRPEDMDRAVELIAAAAAKLRDMSPLWEAYQAGHTPSEITGRKNGKKNGKTP